MRLLPASLKTWHAAALLAITVLLVYGNTLGHQLVGFDDVGLVGRGAQSLSGIIGDGVSDAATRIWLARPLTRLSQALDLRLFGDDYWGHHAANLLYHLLAVFLAFVVASRLLRSPPWGLAAALIFALHPVQSESVAYLAGRRDLLCGLLSLAAFAAWLGGRMAAGTVLWALSLTAKQSSLVMPLVFLAYQSLLEPDEFRRRIRERRTLFLSLLSLAALIVGAHFYRELNSLADRHFPPSALWYGGSALTQWATEPRILVRALALLVWPATLAADYSWRVFEPARSFFEIKTLLSLGLLAGLAAAAWRVRRREPLICFSLCWTALAYAPMLHLLPSLHNNEPFAEHWLYLPVFAIALTASRLLQLLSASAPRAALLVFAFVTAALGARTVLRNRDWRDDLTLWSSAARTFPECARAQGNLGLARFTRGDPREAERLYKLALTLQPGEHRVAINLADALMAQGRMKEAEAVLREARGYPLARFAMKHIDYNLGRALFYQGRLGEARTPWKRVLEIQGEGIGVAEEIGVSPDDGVSMELQIATMHDLARLELAKGKPIVAEKLLLKLLDKRPDHGPSLYLLGVVRFSQRRFNGAIPLFERLTTVQPLNLDARLYLSLACAETGDFGKSQENLRRAMALAPNSSAVWIAQSALHLKAGRVERAWHAARQAVELENSAQTYRQLQQVRRAMAARAARP